MASDRKKPLKIALQAAYLLEGRGGIEHFCVRLATYLSDQGHDVVLFARELPGRTPAYPIDSRVRLELYRLDGGREYRRRLAEYLLDQGIEVFMATLSNRHDFFWPAVLSTTSIPLFVTEHTDPQIIENEKWNRAERLATLALSDLCHVLLPDFASSVPSAWHNKLRVLPLPLLHTMPLVASVSPPYPRIIAAGRLVDSIKQYSLLIEAFAGLHLTHPEWRLVIWGEGPDRPRLEAMAARLKVFDRVTLPGLSTTLPEEFAVSHIYCVPSRYEGFGLSTLEALSCGLPAVGFAQCAGSRALIRNGRNGLLAEAMTAESLADALKTLMDDAPLRQRMGRQATLDSATYLPEKIFPLWEDALYDCAGTSPLLRDNVKDETFAAQRFLLKMLFSPQKDPAVASPACSPDIAALQKSIAARQQRLRQLRNSWSWRLSAPLRYFGTLAQRLRRCFERIRSACFKGKNFS